MRIGSPLAIAFALLATSTIANAEPMTVVGNVTKLSDGQFRYDYTVTNTDENDFGIPIFDPDTGEIIGIEKGPGSRIVRFELFPPLPEFITQMANTNGFAEDFPARWTTIYGSGPGRGESAQFSLVSVLGPGSISYEVQYAYLGEESRVDSGEVVGPAVQAPEPASGLLFGLGALALVGVRSLRRCRW